MSSTRKAEYVADARRCVRQIVEGHRALKALQGEWNWGDYLNTLGEHDGLTPADIGAAVFDTATAIETLLSQGHGTNLAKLL